MNYRRSVRRPRPFAIQKSWGRGRRSSFGFRNLRQVVAVVSTVCLSMFFERMDRIVEFSRENNPVVPTPASRESHSWYYSYIYCRTILTRPARVTTLVIPETSEFMVLSIRISLRLYQVPQYIHENILKSIKNKIFLLFPP